MAKLVSFLIAVAVLAFPVLVVIQFRSKNSKRRALSRKILVCIIFLFIWFYFPAKTPLPDNTHSVIGVQLVRFNLAPSFNRAKDYIPNNVSDEILSECNKQVAIRSAWRTLIHSQNSISDEGVYIYFSDNGTYDMTKTVVGCSQSPKYDFLKKGNQYYWLLGDSDEPPLFIRLKAILSD